MFEKIKDYVRRKSYITIYALAEAESPQIFLTICDEVSQCIEYIDKIFRDEYLNEFKIWCNLNGKNVSEESSWLIYRSSELASIMDERYIVQKLTYTSAAICPLMRMFSGCRPIGCSYEKPMEKDYFQNIFMQKVAEGASLNE